MNPSELDYIEGLLHAGLDCVNASEYWKAISNFKTAIDEIKKIIKMVRSYECM